MHGGIDSALWHDYSPSLRAILDEYARAVGELGDVLSSIPATRYTATTSLSDDCFPNIKTICDHVIGCIYLYADYIEDALDQTNRGTREHGFSCATLAEAAVSLWPAFQRTVSVLSRIKGYGDEELEAVRFTTRWEQPYDIEQMLEHAIVHILRHRRQIERWLVVGSSI
ncbi:MAG TPA: hypothetical protein VM118_10095 [Acidobacteriota bacterium]|nr:hypothetical protein [Acidobacteriota bacterium]